MPDREKLVELVDDYTDHLSIQDIHKADFAERFADHLIAHGVTVQEWIPVSEPPKKNGYYMCWKLFSAVGERREYREEILFYEDNMWLENARSFRKEYPLYWMPLPQPPKGD